MQSGALAWAAVKLCQYDGLVLVKLRHMLAASVHQAPICSSKQATVSGVGGRRTNVINPSRLNASPATAAAFIYLSSLLRENVPEITCLRLSLLVLFGGAN